jgi:iduronate 2-sulfatase
MLRALVNEITEWKRPGQSDCPVNATMDGTLLNPSQDHEFCDKIIADDGVAKMRLLSANRKRTGQPFFQAVGFRKPHLAFRFPAPWLSLFPNAEDIPLAKHPTMDRSVPTIAHHDASPQGLGPFVPPQPAVAKQWRLFYMATIAWMDSQLGRVLTELETLGHLNDTLTVSLKRLPDESPWSQFTSECQWFWPPPRLNK